MATMSARKSRSISRTLEETPKGVSVARSRSPTSSPSLSPSTSLALDLDDEAITPSQGPLPNLDITEATPLDDPLDDQPSTVAATNPPVQDLDSGSSSILSELDEDVSDEEDELSIAAGHHKAADAEVDSEAETERLDKTPHKPKLFVDGPSIIDKSPSKLSKVMTADDLDSEDSEDGDSEADDGEQHGPSTQLRPNRLSAINETSATLGKRKRGSSGASSLSDVPLEEPIRKRKAITDDILAGGAKDVPTTDLESDVDDDKVDGEVSGLDPKEVEGAGADEVDDSASIKGLHVKGKRKGKQRRLVDEVETPAETPEALTNEIEEPADEEVEEEEETSHDEELAKRREAAESLAEIERAFYRFREQHIQEQLDQAEHELSLLQSPTCKHPDYLTRLECVDQRRDDKVRHEDTLLKYNLQALVNKTVAERLQLLSQYHQDVREIRVNTIMSGQRQVFALQQDRRRFGAEPSACLLYKPSPVEQVRTQQAYNMEVSILTGIAKNVGFPAAPQLTTLPAAAIHADLEAMRVQPPPSSAPIRPQQFAVPTAAEERFYEQTPWANPQHPAHAHAPINTFHTQTSAYATPAQKRFADTSAVNGSASTIEMVSNPPSSAAQAPPGGNPTFRPDAAAETPVPAMRNSKHIGETHRPSGPVGARQVHAVDPVLGQAGPPYEYHHQHVPAPNHSFTAVNAPRQDSVPLPHPGSMVGKPLGAKALQDNVRNAIPPIGGGGSGSRA